MARTVVGSAVVVREKYFWPDAQLNFWTIIMLASAGTILGVFSEFLMIQNRMRQEVPWYVSYRLFSHSSDRRTGLHTSGFNGISAHIWECTSATLANTPIRIIPYGITVGALTIIWIIVMLILIAQRRLLPGVVLLFSFILLVLFIAGIIGTALNLFAGPNISGQCSTYVQNMPQYGPSVNTLAWLQQNNICEFVPFRMPFRASI
jgi:hypothetical protein